MRNLSEEEIKFLIIGVRLQIDECEKQLHNYDPDVRNIYEEKKKKLYNIWKKLETN